MNIYLLRHGISEANEKRLVCGASDYPLSTRGLAQAEAICEQLNTLNYTRIYCSPLQRAKQTIEHLKNKNSTIIVPELVELDTGDVSHITVDELYSHSPEYRYQGLSPNLRYPRGESLNEMLTRVIGWYEIEKIKWTDSDSVLIAGHEGTVCAILHNLLKLDVSHYPTFSIGNCDRVHINIADNQMRIRFVNFNDPTVEINK